MTNLSCYENSGLSHSGLYGEYQESKRSDQNRISSTDRQALELHADVFLDLPRGYMRSDMAHIFSAYSRRISPGQFLHTGRTCMAIW
jgi:hypothetical protein